MEYNTHQYSGQLCVIPLQNEIVIIPCSVSNYIEFLGYSLIRLHDVILH